MKKLLGNKEFEINALKQLVEKLVQREKVAQIEIQARDDRIRTLVEENVKARHIIRRHEEDAQNNEHIVTREIQRLKYGQH